MSNRVQPEDVPGAGEPGSVGQTPQQGEELFRTLATAAPAAIFIYQGTKFRYVNDAMVELTGYSREELFGMDFWEVAHPDVRDAGRQRGLARQRGEPVPQRYELKIARKNGEEGWMDLSAAVIELEGEPAVLAMAQDISKRCELERFKDELISVVAHELRAPLTAIQGSLEWLVAEETALSEKQREVTAVAARNSQRMSDLIRDLLDADKAEAGKVEFDLGPVGLGPLVAQGVELIGPSARAADVRLRVGEVPTAAVVRADRDRLLQVLTNLLSNAVKFSPTGEEVTVAAFEREASWRLGVTDRGLGVPEGFRGRIFRKFAQARSLDPRQKGSGLGLAISKAIVEGLGGRIGYESQPGVQTTFHFDLPAWDGD